MILFKSSENVKAIEEIQLNNLRVITNQIITMSKTMSKHIEYIPEMIVNFFKRYSFDDLASKFFQDVICLCECWLEQSPNDSNFYILITKNYDKIKNDEKFIDFRNNEIAREIELFRNIPIKFAEKLYSKIYELSFNYGLKPKEISEKLQNEFIPETLEGMIKELALPESSKIFINFTKFKYKQPLENVRKKIEKIENQNRDNFSIEKLSEIEKEIKENISKLEEIEIEFEKAKESIVKYKILDRISFFEDELKELEYISKKAFNLLHKISKEKEKIHCIVKDVGEIDPNPPYGKHGINGQYVKKTEAEQKKIEEKIKEKKENKIETGGQRGEEPLTDKQIKENINIAISYGMPKDRIKYSEYNNTAHSGIWDYLIIGTDVYPKNAKTANGRLSNKAALAHELIGHREAFLNGWTQNDYYLEEIQASIRAARFTPDLTNAERFNLLRDAAERAKKKNIRLKDIKNKLYIESRGEQ